MSFSELGHIIRKRWWLFVVIPVAFVIIAGIILMTRPVMYSATATITTSGEIAAIGSIAEGEIIARSSVDPSASVKTTATSKTVGIITRGSSPEACISYANEIARATSEGVAKVYADKVKVNIYEARDAGKTSPSKAMILTWVFAAGVIVAFLVLIIEDGIRKPLRRVREIGDSTGVPCVGPIRSADDYKLLVHGPLFSVGGVSIHAIPVEDEQLAQRFVKQCKECGVTCIDRCASFVAGAESASIINSEDIVLVIVKEWVDTQAKLDKSLSRMALAGIKPDCILLVQ